MYKGLYKFVYDLFKCLIFVIYELLLRFSNWAYSYGFHGPIACTLSTTKNPFGLFVPTWYKGSDGSAETSIKYQLCLLTHHAPSLLVINPTFCKQLILLFIILYILGEGTSSVIRSCSLFFSMSQSLSVEATMIRKSNSSLKQHRVLRCG